MKKHILLIIDGLRAGGAENITLTLAKGMIQRGYAVTLMSLSKHLSYPIPDQVKYIVDHDDNKGMFHNINELARRAASLDRQVSNLFTEYGKPCLVISNLHKTDRIVARSRILKSCNLWYCIHSMFSCTYLGNKSGFTRWLKQKKLQKIYKNCNIITVSEAIAVDLLKYIKINPSKCITIYNPFNINEIQHRAMEFNPFHDQDYMLHVGRFHQVKCHHRLLEAFALASLPINLILIGQGKLAVTEAIRLKIAVLNLQDKVFLAGFQANPFPIIKGAKMVVLSSDSEGLSTVLIEALICHVSIVSTACPGGIVEIMSGKLASYISEMNVPSLAEKMRLAWHTPIQITTEMYSRFNHERVLDKYLSLVDSRS
ncbi:glycosyltransferase [Candidatus Gillettellia adelgis]